MKAVPLALAITTIAVLSLTTTAQNIPSRHGAQTDAFSWGPPPPAPNILFYGGDTNTSDPNQDAFINGDTVFAPNSPTYGAVNVPARGRFLITGVFFNQIATGTGNVFDPPTATYDIRINVSNGYGGTSIASGTGPQHAQPTGRLPFGYVEYTTSVALTTPLTAPNGETIWVNESPQCTDSGNPVCEMEQFFVDNTTQKTGSVNGGAQPTGQSYFDCNYCTFGFEWFNICEEGANAQQCADLSFGIYGHRQSQ